MFCVEFLNYIIADVFINNTKAQTCPRKPPLHQRSFEMNRNNINNQIQDLVKVNHAEIFDVSFPFYHYTGIEGINGILGDNNFYVSQSDFLNDRTEIAHFQKIYENAISVLTNGRPFDNDVRLFMSYCKIFSEYLKVKNHSFVENDSLYVLSFTSNNDHLPLWSSYTSNTGYNIGFNNNLNKYFENKGMKFWVGNVIYDEDRQYEIIADGLSEASKIWSQADNLGISDQITEEINKKLFDKFQLYSMFLKNHLFDSEEEVRIVFKKRDSDKMFHRCSNGIFIPYIKVNFRKECVRSVCVGPINNLDNAQIGLKSFLNNNGYREMKINKSKIPLRY